MDKVLFLRTADREQLQKPTKYRYKTTACVQNRIHRRDEDGFFLPYAMFKPYTGAGLLCAVLGTTPSRRMKDLTAQREYLLKEAYEHEIELLMCRIRLYEFTFHRRFCMEDRTVEWYERQREAGNISEANSDQNAAEHTAVPKVTSQSARQILLKAVTWRYDWIQQNKKRCFEFAEAVIDCKLLLEEKRDAVLKRRGLTYEGQRKRMEDFIREAAEMHEPNRRLMDFMYEIAWNLILEYRYGYPQDRVPAPWYDKLVKSERKNEKENDACDAGSHEDDTDGAGGEVATTDADPASQLLVGGDGNE